MGTRKEIRLPKLPLRAAQNNKALIFMSENNASAGVFYILVRFFAVSYKTATSNDQIIGFVENVNTRRLIFLSLFKIESRPYEFNSLCRRGSQKVLRKRRRLRDSGKLT